ncbi:MAG: chemotaxis protein CheW [bacterium]
MALLDTHRGGGQQAEKYLIFRLAGEEYGFPVLSVQEIIQWVDVTRVPRMPAMIQGVINLRGKVVPVLNLRLRFDLPDQDITARTCIVVLQVQQEQGQLVCGVMVDEVTEVLDLPAERIEKPPEFGDQVDTGFMAGIGQIGARVIMLLNVARILDRKEWRAVEQTAIRAENKGEQS